MQGQDKTPGRTPKPLCDEHLKGTRYFSQIRRNSRSRRSNSSQSSEQSNFFVFSDSADLEQHFKQIFFSTTRQSTHTSFEQIRVSPQLLKRYLCKYYPENMAVKVTNFLDLPHKLTYTQYYQCVEVFGRAHFNEIMLLVFILLDWDQDGFITHQDLYQLVFSQGDCENHMLTHDIQTIQNFVRQSLNIYQNYVDQHYKIESMYSIKGSVTLGEFRKMKASTKIQLALGIVKKDTIYFSSY